MQIIFAQTRYSYQSYTDYTKLVGLSRFDTCYVDEIDLSKNAIYLVSPINGEFRPHIENQLKLHVGNKQAKLIWINLERPIEVKWEDLQDKSKPVFACTKQSFDTMPEYVDQVWVADRLFAESMQNDRVKFVPIGSHPDLGKSELRNSYSYPWGNFVYDYAMMAYIDGRRIAIRDALSDLSAAPNAWPPFREEILAQTKCMLNVHQSDHLIGEPLRFAVGAANKIPIISETIIDPFPMQPNLHYVSEDYANLANKVRTRCNYFSDSFLNSEISNNLYELLCEDYRFGKNIKKAIEEL